jgi:hypothetical protein
VHAAFFHNIMAPSTIELVQKQFRYTSIESF